jgi:DNA repair protein RadC
VNFRARFLQGRGGGGDGRARSHQRSARYARRFCGSQALVGLIEHCGQLAQPALGAAAERGLLIGRPLGGALRALAGVERVVQRQAIVPLRDRLIRAFEGSDRSVVLLGRIPIGTRCASGVDGALCLIHFAGWRIAARGNEQACEQQDGSRNAPNTTQHRPEYTPPLQNMKALAINDRPREKLFRLGAAGLGDNELIAIVVGSGSRRGNALALANEILDNAGGLHGIARVGADDLRRLDGMGAAKAAQVLAAIELGRRTLLRCPPARVQFGNPRDVAAYLLPQFGAKPVEQFGLVMLDTKHRLLRTAIISVGTLDSSPAHPREIFREAASASAAAIVLFHNHPSGDPTPSRDDVDLTRRLIRAGELMGIDVLDHVILADTRYFSFRESGRL